MKIKRQVLVTVNGDPVWTNGLCKYAVGERGGRHQADSLAYEPESQRQQRIDRAEKQTGLTGLHYVAGEDAEVSSI